MPAGKRRRDEENDEADAADAVKQKPAAQSRGSTGIRNPLKFIGQIIMEDEKQSLATAKGREGFRSTFNEVVLASFCDGSATENTSDPDPPGAYAVVTRCFCPGMPNDGKRIEFAYHVDSSYSTSKVMEAAGALQAVRFSFAHIRHTLQGVPQPQRPAMATIMVFFDCQSVQKDLLSGRYAEERLSWHVVYNQLLGQIAQLSQEIADNDLGVVIGLELRWIKGHAKGHATKVDAHNCVHKLAYAARDGASIGMIGGARVPLFPGVLDGNYKIFLDGLYTSSNLPYDNKKRKAALFESTPSLPPAKRRRYARPQQRLVQPPLPPMRVDLPLRLSQPPVIGTPSPNGPTSPSSSTYASCLGLARGAYGKALASSFEFTPAHAFVCIADGAGKIQAIPVTDM